MNHPYPARSPLHLPFTRYVFACAAPATATMTAVNTASTHADVRAFLAAAVD
ncbi:hypothetical protein [Nocardia xishanensis]